MKLWFILLGIAIVFFGETRKATYVSKSRYEAESLIGSEVEVVYFLL